jgi:hypothetical protein
MNKEPVKRATNAEVFVFLEHLLGPEARTVIDHTANSFDAGDPASALAKLKVFDARIGGVGLHEYQGEKFPGIYRPFSYVMMSLGHDDVRDEGRHIAIASCAYLESLLKRMALWGLFEIADQHTPMGMLLRSIRHKLPQQLYEDLRWMTSRIYNFAKHDYSVNDRPTPEEREHYFTLEEALAVYFSARQLGRQLEKYSGKTSLEFMAG